MYQELPGTPVPVRMWTDGVPVEQAALQQLRNVANLRVMHPRGMAVMPDVHWGNGATVGSVIPTVRAIVPAAVGVDIGCGMVAAKTTLHAEDLPDSLREMRIAIESAVPHGGPGIKGSWLENGYRMPKSVEGAWTHESTLSAGSLQGRYRKIVDKHAQVSSKADVHQLGSLGGGNHFIEICLDAVRAVWVMLHSGSRGPGNRIGTYFIEVAKNSMEKGDFERLGADKNLAFLEEGAEYFDDYVEALLWAQDYARTNRDLMMAQVIGALRSVIHKPFQVGEVAVNCHHNYVQREHHFGEDVWLTRKGAVSARAGELGIIPGSMGARSYIVRGKGNPESFHSCSHGAGRVMSRGAAKRQFNEADVAKQTEGVECRKDASVVDEIPAAYKDIDLVMAAQSDLVEVVHTLRQVLCVKG